MKVYSVLEVVDYEGSSLLGVFGSRQDALEFLKSYPGFERQSLGYSYGYVESELGQAVDQYGEIEYV